ncbi:MAG: hypothetical protein ACYSVY_02550 [Planctomycetota bacterium]
MVTNATKNRRTGRSSASRTGRGGWHKTTSSSFSHAGGKSSGRKNTKSGGMRGSTVASGYNQISNMFATKVNSFRTLWDQTKGAANRTRPTPATLKTFGNWINKGANIWCVTNSQINKWCKTNQTYKTNAAVKAVLCNKFGKNTIKAVCCAKSGGFIVATAPTCKGKNFKFPC